CQQHNNSPPTF
nr:immunoglobulin light chain junction region [Macaca mulatta]